MEQEPKKNNRFARYADVYVAPLPDQAMGESLYPPLRQSEIDACKSERVRREKYFVWKLFAHAVKARYDKELSELKFVRSDNGKWSCDLCEFSFSHSKGALCVAISDAPIGVDIEQIPTEPPESVAKKILTEEALQRYHGMPKSEKCVFFATEWTHRESLFKQRGGKGFFTAETSGHSQETTVSIGSKEYVLSVASNAVDAIHIIHIDL